MAEKDRLAALKVGVARHQDLSVRLHPVEKDRDEITDSRSEDAEPALQPQTDIGGDLVIARAGGVELAADLTNKIGEAGLDRHVDVFLRFVRGSRCRPGTRRESE